MKIKEIEKQKCGKCPLINLCGDAYEQPCLCCEERLAEIDVQVYKDFLLNWTIKSSEIKHDNSD